ncbi:MAG: hypothetical protein ACRDRM_09050 [Pseudonocardiaceae bacterium]
MGLDQEQPRLDRQETTPADPARRTQLARWADDGHAAGNELHRETDPVLER